LIKRVNTDVNIFISLIANLADNKKILKLIVSIDTVVRALKQPRWGRGGGVCHSQQGLMCLSYQGQYDQRQ
jgi:hypothetical protein